MRLFFVFWLFDQKMKSNTQTTPKSPPEIWLRFYWANKKNFENFFHLKFDRKWVGKLILPADRRKKTHLLSRKTQLLSLWTSHLSNLLTCILICLRVPRWNFYPLMSENDPKNWSQIDFQFFKNLVRDFILNK